MLDWILTQNNPVKFVDPWGTDPLDPFTGEPNSILQCHFNPHWDHDENIRGAMLLGSVIALPIIAESGVIALSGRAVVAAGEYAAAGAYVAYQAGAKAYNAIISALTNAAYRLAPQSQKIVDAVWDVSGTGQPGFFALGEAVYRESEQIIERSSNALRELTNSIIDE